MRRDTGIAGVVLAGGQGSRLGYRDKGWVTWSGRPLIETALERFGPQVGPVALSVNRNHERYARLGCPLLDDNEQYGPRGSQGPLAGVLSGLQWCPRRWLACVPCDLPWLPSDLVARLHQGCGDAPGAYAVDDERAHYLCCLLNIDLAASLSDFLAAGGRAVHRWFDVIGAVPVDFSSEARAFSNINSSVQLTDVDTELNQE